MIQKRTPALRPPSTVDEFLQRLGDEFSGLSRQLKLIGRYVERHRDHLGLEKIQDVATRCEVHPSAVVRFAKHFGYSGYSDLQSVFRQGMTQRIALNNNYQARIRKVLEGARGRLSSEDIAYEFIGGSLAGLQELQRDLQATELDDAVALLERADSFWVAGTRRAFPVAAYLAYALQHTDKPVQMLSFLGAMQQGQLRGVREGDVMIAISFAPYSPETIAAAEDAARSKAKVIAITDSRMSPFAPHASVTLVVHESSTFGFRALTNAMALAQGLFIALAYRLELSHVSGEDAATVAGASATGLLKKQKETSR
jgi:DNA-binding MurR/RpiR family transcriptional regulator